MALLRRSSWRTDSGDSPVRVLLVDGDAEFRHRVRDGLGPGLGVVVVAQASNVADARRAAGTAGIEVALIGVELSDGSGLECCRDLQRERPAVAAVLLAGRDDRRSRLAAALVGTRASVPKSAEASELAAVVREVANGRNLLATDCLDAYGPCGAEQLSEQGRDPLTPREALVRDLFVLGRSEDEVAKLLGVCGGDVRDDIAMILAKTLARQAPR